ncbi:MAG: hypothetical protein IJ019_06120 [Alphaproteobacteria bacterium]|nr:hypothetical protein [Alphaproteobacteria bacterium]
MNKILISKKEIPEEGFLKMMSSSEITSDDVLALFSQMVEYKAAKDVFGNTFQGIVSPVGEELTKPIVCQLKITDLSYFWMEAENLLDLDEEYAFVLNNEKGQTIVWPFLSTEVYVFRENPFRLKTYRWYIFKNINIKIREKQTNRGVDNRLEHKPTIFQYDAEYRRFRIHRSRIVVKEDVVESILKWDNGYEDEYEIIHYPPMWLLRNKPEELKPKPRTTELFPK